MVAGALLLNGQGAKADAYPITGPQVLVDERVSLYSIVGDVFAMIVSLVAVGMVIWTVLAKPYEKVSKK